MSPIQIERDGTRRTYVLDTNVLLYDPTALDHFDEHEIVIPITVIEELDRFKKDNNETGRNARMVSRRLDQLRRQGKLAEGVPLGTDGSLRIIMPAGLECLPEAFGPASNDNIILATLLSLWKERPGRVILVTRDTNMRLKGDALGVRSEDYEHAHIDMDERYKGVTEHDVDGGMIADIYEKGWIEHGDELDGGIKLCPNQFMMLRNHEKQNNTALVRFDERRGRLKLVGRFKEGVWGIFARNKEQLFALDLLLDDSISLVTLDGMAGTGKTLMAMACGLKMVADEHRFKRLVVSRPVFPMGRDIGFLPGDLSEKLNPWMKPIFDNLDLLMGFSENEYRNGNKTPGYQPLLDQGIIEVEPLTYIRGRSLPQQFLVVDEAQNLTPHEVKTVITRAGEGTKVVLTGDPYQIDNPYVDATSNGLTYVVERFKQSSAAGHVTLRKGERSELAELAARLL
jgi:PhoH-like ATPase